VDEIDLARARWTEAINSGSADGFVRCVADDAVWLPPRGEAVQGADALRAWLSDLFDRFHYRFETQRARVRPVGDGWAVEEASFRSVLRPKSGAGEPLVHEGEYTVLWRRLDSGEWRIDRYSDRTA
jgi:uncharacterized protein (TIGR02246 family)